MRVVELAGVGHAPTCWWHRISVIRSSPSFLLPKHRFPDSDDPSAGGACGPLPYRSESVAPLIAATARDLQGQADILARARAFAEPFLVDQVLVSGENTLAHADAEAAILRMIGGSEANAGRHLSGLHL